ncbi:sorbosone dehydrogenase family protein [soil metagenome]
MKSIITLLSTVSFLFVTGCIHKNSITKAVTYDSLPAPYATKSSMNFSNVIGWQENEKPIAPKGFTVSLFADGFDNPRWMYQTPNGDILVGEANTEVGFVKKIGAAIIGATKADNLGKSANRIMLLRDADSDGKPEIKETLLKDLNKPFGMLVIGKYLYVANTDALVRYPYEAGQMAINAVPEKLADLSPDGRHWTKNIITNAAGSKIYVAVGSSSNVAENGMDKEINRANILEMNPDGSEMRVFASGLRNPVGMAWAPGTNTLWTAVNERDELGDDLVPDYITSVKDGGFYGWPYSYYGQHLDPRIKEQQPDLVKKAIVPDVNLGSHTASLGLAFYTKTAFPKKYQDGAFIAQHGSWNRSVLSGYKVVFVPFKNGRPIGKPQDFLTGFVIDPSNSDKVHGRPTGICILQDGSMLVTDDTSNKIWRISYNN